jgi:flagellar biosynthesis protein FlhF
VSFQELIPRDIPRPYSSTSRPAFVPEPPAPPPREAPPAREAPPRAFERRTVAPGSHARARAGVEKSLRRYGIGEELAKELIDAAAAHVLPFAPRAGLAHAVRVTLAQRIPVVAPLSAKGASIALVGAGGAGKTTCCAALLGAYRTSGTLPASCATLSRVDDHGELQMILSPKIMNAIPASNPRALRALRRAKVDGLAVIDTPRASPADRAGIRELAGLLGELKPERVLVALPATLGAAAAAQLLDALAPLEANALALTHADETDQIGVAIEAACRFGLAPEYMLDRGRTGGWRLGRIDPTGLAAKLLQ